MPKAKRPRSELHILISGYYRTSEFAAVTNTPYEVVLEAVRTGRVRATRDRGGFKIPISERPRVEADARALKERAAPSAKAQRARGGKFRRGGQRGGIIARAERSRARP